MGHQGQNRTLSLLKEQCLIFEASVQMPKLTTMLATKPMDLVYIDFVKMEIPGDLQKKLKVKNVLVIVDHFTRLVQVYITKDQMAHTMARILYYKYFAVFGFQRHLMSDQACTFFGNAISQMCDYLKIDKIHMSPYHP